MFLKIKNLVINSEYVIGIDFKDPRGCTLHLHGRPSVILPESAGLYILEMLETNVGYIPDNESAPTSDLKGRVAVLLRDTWKSATCSQIAATLNEDAGFVLEALLFLIAENVVVVDTENERNHVYYHASNKPKYLTPNRDPLSEDVEHGLIDLSGDSSD